jgi:uncharacterized protein (DUF488 family)
MKPIDPPPTQLGLALDAAPKRHASATGPELLTIGHSNRSAEMLADILRAHRVAHLADIRAMPYSRRHPHFGREAIADSLATAGIAYSHWPALGGRRLAHPSSPNLGVAGALRGFADHMASTAFAQAIASLAVCAAQSRLALMCAEADPMQCHRRLVADHCVAQGWRVTHLRDERTIEPHRLSPEARVDAGIVTYPARLTR